ncbi:hypothetical protein FOL47_002638 [Perkinsus chesapeaki]|uniref:Uncharacterized protein n=1 Tax=Perkinsus chesapeaki TaxID=330153 RepID=A0A7J6MCG7_PERCH|nr:hypothetical protein FOL47_002638 [Perkinsus chesapeaki]
MSLQAAGVLTRVSDCLSQQDVIAIALCSRDLFGALTINGRVKTPNVNVGLSYWSQSALFRVDPTTVRRLRIHLDYYVDRTSDAELLIDGLKRLTLIEELTLKFNPRRAGSADLALEVSYIFSGLTRLEFVCCPKHSHVPPKRSLRSSHADTTLKALGVLAKRNRYRLRSFTLRCDPDIRVTTFPIMARLTTLVLHGRIGRDACLTLLRALKGLETFVYIRDKTDPNIWTSQHVEDIYRLVKDKFKCLVLSSVKPPDALSWAVKHTMEEPGRLWLVKPVARGRADCLLYRCQVVVVDITRPSKARSEILESIGLHGDRAPFSVLCRLLEDMPYGSIAQLWASEFSESDRQRWSDCVVPVLMQAVASFTRARPHYEERFTLSRQRGSGLLAQFQKKASPVPKAAPLGVSARQLKEEKKNALLAKKKAAQQPKDDWFFSGTVPSESPTSRPVMGHSQSAKTFDLDDEDEDEDDFKFFSGEALRARQQSEPALRPQSSTGTFKCVNLLDMGDLIGENDITTQPSSGQCARIIPLVFRALLRQPLQTPVKLYKTANLCWTCIIQVSALFTVIQLQTICIVAPVLVASSPELSINKSTVPSATPDSTPIGEKVFLLEQRLRDAEAEKEIAVDIVKDELAHANARNDELMATVRNKEEALEVLKAELDDFRAKADSNGGSGSTEVAKLKKALEEVEERSKGEIEKCTARTSQLENDLLVRDGELQRLKSESNRAKGDADELQRLTVDVEALRKERDELAAKVREAEESQKNTEASYDELARTRTQEVTQYEEKLRELELKAQNTTDMEGKANSLSSKLDELTTTLRQREEEAGQSANALEEHHVRIVALESEVQHLQSSLEAASLEVQRLKEEAAEGEASRQQLQSKLDEEEHNLLRAQEERDDARSRLSQLEADAADVAELKAAVGSASDEITELKSQVSRQEKELQSARVELEQSQAQVTGLSGAKTELEEAITAAKEKHCEEVERLLSERAAEVTSLEEKFQHADAENQRHREEMKTLKTQLAHGLKVEKELLQTRAALDKARAIQSDNEEELTAKRSALSAAEVEKSELVQRLSDLEAQLESLASQRRELESAREKAETDSKKYADEAEGLRQAMAEQAAELESKKKALAGSDEVLREASASVAAVVELKAVVAAKDSELADLTRHVEELSSAMETERGNLEESKAREMADLEQTLKADSASATAQLHRQLESTETELATLRRRLQNAEAELDELRTATTRSKDATMEEISRSKSSLDSVLYEQQQSYAAIMAVLRKAIESSRGLSHISTSPPQQASFSESLSSAGGVSSAHSSVPGSPDPAMAWYTEDEEFLPKRRSSFDRGSRPSSAPVYNINDEIERTDTALPDPSLPSFEEGRKVSNRVSDVVEALLSQLREAERGRLRLETELEECQRELDLRRSEADRPYFAEVLRCRWPFARERSDAHSALNNRTSTRSSELRNLMAFRDLESGGGPREISAPLPPRPVDFDEVPLWKLRQPLVPQDEWVDLEFERMGLQEAPTTGEVMVSPWKGDAAPSPVHPMWPNPSLEMAREEPFTALRSASDKSATSPLVKTQIGRNRARLDALWKLSSSHGISWDELDDHFVQWHAEYTHRAGQFKENLDKFRLEARDAALPYLAAQKLKFHVRRGGSWTDGLPPFAPKRIRRQGEKFLYKWRRRYITAHFQPGILSEYLKSKAAHSRRELWDRLVNAERQKDCLKRLYALQCNSCDCIELSVVLDELEQARARITELEDAVYAARNWATQLERSITSSSNGT